jgi:hypothetical protein
MRMHHDVCSYCTEHKSRPVYCEIFPNNELDKKILVAALARNAKR